MKREDCLKKSGHNDLTYFQLQKRMKKFLHTSVEF